MRALYDAPATLLMFPNRGRPGKKEGTRELVTSPLPYIVVYAVRGDGLAPSKMIVPYPRIRGVDAGTSVRTSPPLSRKLFTEVRSDMIRHGCSRSTKGG